MVKYTFKGRVLPEARKISIEKHPFISWDAPESGVSFVFSLRIVNNAVTVECWANKDGAPQQLSQMRMRALDIARTAVNLVAFTTGEGLSVVLDTVIHPSGAERPILMRQFNVSKFATAYVPDDGRFERLLSIIYQDPPWFLALNDLVTSIYTPHVAPINCARAVEAIRHLFRSGGTRSDDWEVMRTALNIAQSFLQPVSDISTSYRHGSTDYLQYSIADDVQTRAWVVMNRFVEYRLRNNQRLTEPDFPLLT